MLHIAMEPEDFEFDADADNPVRLAIVVIEILSSNLPPAHVLPPLLEQFPKLATSNNPYERRAAIASIGAVMEGSLEFMADYIEDVLPHVLAALRDSEGFVVRTALYALSQITEELPSEVVKHHSTMVPVVFDLLGSNDLETMKAACNTLDAILEWIPQDAVTQYLPKLMEALLYILTIHVDADFKVIVSGIQSSSNDIDNSGNWNCSTCLKGGILPISRFICKHVLLHERSRRHRTSHSPRLCNRYPRNYRQRGWKREIPTIPG